MQSFAYRRERKLGSRSGTWRITYLQWSNLQWISSYLTLQELYGGRWASFGLRYTDCCPWCHFLHPCCCVGLSNNIENLFEDRSIFRLAVCSPAQNLTEGRCLCRFWCLLSYACFPRGHLIALWKLFWKRAFSGMLCDFPWALRYCSACTIEDKFAIWTHWF